MIEKNIAASKASQSTASACSDASERKYPCLKCGKLRTKDEGGTTFTLCDACWDAANPKDIPALHISMRGIFVLDVMRRLEAMKNPEVTWSPSKEQMDRDAIAMMIRGAELLLGDIAKELGHDEAWSAVHRLSNDCGLL